MSPDQHGVVGDNREPHVVLIDNGESCIHLVDNSMLIIIEIKSRNSASSQGNCKVLYWV